jgi:hypothetical protein
MPLRVKPHVDLKGQHGDEQYGRQRKLQAFV